MGLSSFRSLPLSALSALLLLVTTACDIVENGSGASIPDQTTVPAVGAEATVTTALFDPRSKAFDAFLKGEVDDQGHRAPQPLPLPSDLLFAGTSDGTLNIPISDPNSPVAGPVSAANTLDGFSTVAPITIPFSEDVDLDLSTYADPATLDDHLLFIDVTAPGELVTVLPVFDTSSHSLILTPAQPLRDASQYLVVLHGDLRDSAGARVLHSATFYFTKGTEPLYTGDPSDPVIQSSLLQTKVNAGELTPEDVVNLEALRKVYQEKIYAPLEKLPQPIFRDDVIVAFTYTTQTITDQLLALRAAVDGLPGGAGAGGLTVSNVFLNADNFSFLEDPPPAGLGVAVPMDTVGAIVTGTFQSTNFIDDPAAGSFLSADDSRSLTTLDPSDPSHAQRLTVEPVPVSTVDLQYTLFLPKQPATPNGAPLVIFQHGITANRSAAFAIANSLAAARLATIAIDLPLHGSRYLRGTPVNITGGITGGVPLAARQPEGDDGGFINLLSLLTTRDNVRQGWADLWQLVAAIKETPADILEDGAVTADLLAPPAIDVGFVGHSLGAIVGAGFLAGEPDVAIGLLASGGSVITDLLRHSLTFGPVIDQALSDVTRGTVVPGTPAYNLFFLLAQTIVDAADPANLAGGVAQQILLQEGVGDAVIPNLNTELLADHLGLQLLDPFAQNLLGLTTVPVGTGYDGSGLFQFGTADAPVGHAFLLRPEDTLPDMMVVANPVAEAQTQMATYFRSYLATLPDGMGTIIDPFAAAP